MTARKNLSILVRNDDTGEIFESLKEAGYKYNVNPSSIISNCKGKIKSAGKHNITNEKLVWRYYNESQTFGKAYVR